MPGEGEELQFPVLCHFRIIAEDRGGIHVEIEAVFRGEGHDIRVEKGSRSAEGKYQTFMVSIQVESRAQMKALDDGLKAVPGVRMVL